MVERIAHDVHQRIDEALDDQLVELGIRTLELERDILAEISTKTPSHARQLLEDLAHRNHSNIEHSRLQLLELAVEVLVNLGQLAARLRCLRVGRKSDC